MNKCQRCGEGDFETELQFVDDQGKVDCEVKRCENCGVKIIDDEGEITLVEDVNLLIEERAFDCMFAWGCNIKINNQYFTEIEHHTLEELLKLVNKKLGELLLGER